MRSSVSEKELTFSKASFFQYVEGYMRAHGFIADGEDAKITDLIIGHETVIATVETRKEERMVSVTLGADRIRNDEAST